MSEQYSRLSSRQKEVNSRTAIRADRRTGLEKGLAGCFAVLERRASIERAVYSPENGKVVAIPKDGGLYSVSINPTAHGPPG